MSPEQARGDHVDARTDVYSLGMTVYEMLAGRVPFEADTTLSVLHKRIYDPPPPITGLSEKMQDVIDRALAKDPNQRFQTPLELAEAFEAAITGPTEAETMLFPSAVAKSITITRPNVEAAIKVDRKKFFMPVIVGLIGIAVVFAEVFSIIAFIGAAIAAVFFAGLLRPLVESFTPLSGPLASVAAGLAVFLVVFIVVTVITSTVAKTAHQSTEIGSFDRAGGLAFGVLRGIIVVALFVLLVRQAQPQDSTTPADPMQDAIRGARTYSIYDGVAQALEAILPQARDRARDIIDQQKGESAPIPPAETTLPPETGQN